QVPSLFFFSSRRRHTRLQGDWSSDVCSSDLTGSRRESDRYFFRALSFCDQLNDFALSRREPVVPHSSLAGQCSAFQIALQNHGRDFGGEIRFAVGESVDRENQIASGI